MKIVVEKLVKEVWVICFDEFFVLDIIDVMIFGILMEVFFGYGVVFVVILNIVFDEFYKNGF